MSKNLLFDLEESDEQIAAAWASELERRSRDVSEGKVRTVEWSVAHAEILAELEERRQIARD